MRDPATGDDQFSIVCPPCFAELAGESGVLEGATIWHFAPHDVDTASLWADPDGRVWDATQCLWTDAAPTGREPRTKAGKALLEVLHANDRANGDPPVGWETAIIRIEEQAAGAATETGGLPSDARDRLIALFRGDGRQTH